MNFFINYILIKLYLFEKKYINFQYKFKLIKKI